MPIFVIADLEDFDVALGDLAETLAIFLPDLIFFSRPVLRRRSARPRTKWRSRRAWMDEGNATRRSSAMRKTGRRVMMVLPVVNWSVWQAINGRHTGYATQQRSSLDAFGGGWRSGAAKDARPWHVSVRFQFFARLYFSNIADRMMTRNVLLPFASRCVGYADVELQETQNGCDTCALGLIISRLSPHYLDTTYGTLW